MKSIKKKTKKKLEPRRIIKKKVAPNKRAKEAPLPKKEKSVFLTAEEHYKALDDILKKNPHTAYIATYGVYAGVSSNGKDNFGAGENKTRDFLDKLRRLKDVRILVGLPYPGAKQTEEEYTEALWRILHTAKAWPKFDWRFTKNSHLKLFAFSKEGGNIGTISGGRNLTDSTFSDESFLLNVEQSKATRHKFHSIFGASKKVSKENLGL